MTDLTTTAAPASPALTPQQIVRKRAAGEPVFPDDTEQAHEHVVTVRLENTLGALNRAVNLFSARGFNLDSVSVGETEDRGVSRMTLVTRGNDRVIAQVVRQLDNLVDVHQVEDLCDRAYVERELCLVSVRYKPETRREILDTIEIFRGKVVNVTPDIMTIEVTGPTKKVNAFIGLMEPLGIEEVARRWFSH